jgi:anti-sigma regulatory factor (Ser/Thr protein kinase)
MTSVSSQGHPPGEAGVLSLDLEQNREAPSLARAAIAGFSEDREIGERTLATLTLLVSEIVTNAVIHPDVEPPGDIRLRARIADGLIRVEVTDQGDGFEPAPRDPARSDRGYGLYLLEKQARRWGVDQRAGTTVWFELALRVA